MEAGRVPQMSFSRKFSHLRFFKLDISGGTVPVNSFCSRFTSITQRSLPSSGIFLSTSAQRPWVYPYPRVSDFEGRNSDHGPSKTQTKTQTTPDSVFTRERRNSDHGLSFWEDHGLSFGLPRDGGRSCLDEVHNGHWHISGGFAALRRELAIFERAFCNFAKYRQF